ncbi:hypothetical protein Tco_0285188 [Tanacetum coccineum]
MSLNDARSSSFAHLRVLEDLFDATIPPLNFSLKKWYDAKKQLAGVLGQKNEAMKCQTDLLERMKALEQQGGSLCRADALGTLVDEYLRWAKAYEGRAKALRQRA